LVTANFFFLVSTCQRVRQAISWAFRNQHEEIWPTEGLPETNRGGFTISLAD